MTRESMRDEGKSMMMDVQTGRGGTGERDLLMVCTSAGVTCRGEDDGDGVAWFELDVDGIKMVLSAGLDHQVRRKGKKEGWCWELAWRIAARSVLSSKSNKMASVSGSPKRTLYSRTLGPESVRMKPVKRRPTKGWPGDTSEIWGEKKEKEGRTVATHAVDGRA